MDSFWIILLIFGAIVSIGQKSSKKQPENTDTDDSATPEQEFERRIRELLEGRPASAPKAEPQPAPKAEQTPEPTTAQPSHKGTPSVAPTRKPRMHTTPAQTLSRQPLYRQGATTPQIATREATTSRMTHTITTPAPKTATDPIKAKEIKSGKIGQIIDDFTIDKAVIYSEIMKPKYEEY